MDYKYKLGTPLRGLLILILLVTCADAATLNVPADYATIQAAVNAAAAGDTILVQSGTYYENVNVNKQLTLQGVDSGSGLPVVDAGGSGSAITLSANGCTLKDFVAMNSSTGQSGIRVTSSSNTISGNTATGNPNSGIRLDFSSNGNTISSNTANINGVGILLSSSSGNTISGNTATGNSNYGIYLASSSSNIISGNTANGNTYGIHLSSGSGNTISGNTANSNTDSGIYLSLSSSNNISGNTATLNSNYGIQLASNSNGNTISGNTVNGNTNYGIYLNSCSNNTISGNTATGNRQGIVPAFSSSNIIFGNIANSNTNYGIHLIFSNGNTISSNTATGNSEGIRLSSSSSNNISGNTANSNINLGIILNSASSNTISGNTATGNTYGILLSSSSSNAISGNTATGNNQRGIYLISSSNGNNISGNTATGNVYGIHLSSSSSNIIYLNTLDSGFSNGANNWNSTTQIAYGNGTTYVGNNWSNYAGFDCDGNGIGDTPYPVAGGSDIDYHPIGGLPCLTCIDGYKLDGCGEPLEGWSIFVDSDRSGTLDSGEPANVTDVSGYWQICDLEAGVEVRVAEQSKAGWRASQPSTGWQDITVEPANATAYVNFTNDKLMCISGYKINECTGEGLKGWTILLNNSSYSTSAITVSDGKYEFCGLLPGHYTVKESVASGWTPVSASVLSLDLTCDVNLTNQNFTDTPLVSISGYKLDKCSQTGLPNWTITLTNGSYSTDTITNSSGRYEFRGLMPGDYTVGEIGQSGWKINGSHDVGLRCGNITNLNFTNQKMYCISGYKKDNCTGAPLSGWNITLQNATHTVSQLTGPDGKYEFCNLRPGDYTITEEARSGYTAVSVVANPVSLNCRNITNQNFTNQKLLCISGKKINHCTGYGLGNWTITVRNSTGAIVGTALTITNPVARRGNWQVCGLLPGNYTVTETLKSGYLNITNLTQNVILDCVNVTGIDFSNVPLYNLGGYKYDNCTGEPLGGWDISVKNLSTGKTINVTTSNTIANRGRWRVFGLAPGLYQVTEIMKPGYINTTPAVVNVTLVCENNYGIDFTNQKLLCISGYKKDNSTGSPLPGWNITLQNATHTVSQLTGPDGKYEFCNLRPSDYTITEEARPGYTAVSIVANPVTLNCSNITNQNFTNTLLPCIEGWKIDHETGEGIAGWTISLSNSSGILRNTSTNFTGWYQFCDLEPGRYTVCEENRSGWTNVTPTCIDVDLGLTTEINQNFTNTLLPCIEGWKIDHQTGEGIAGWTISLSNSSGRLKNTTTNFTGWYQFCDLEPGRYTVCEGDRTGWTNVTSTCIDVNLGLITEINQNFTNTLLPCIEGWKIDHETGEGIAGWTISLSNSSGILRNTSTNFTGWYQFCDLEPGRYTVCEENRSGWTNVTPTCIDVDLGLTTEINQNFTNTLLPCIEGWKINYETGKGIAGWTISLSNSSGRLKNTTTNFTGWYQFCDLEPGRYKVCEGDLPGWTNVTPTCLDVDLGLTTEINQNFTNTLLPCIEGWKIDHQTGEGIAGWTISLSNSSGRLKNTTTNFTGWYQFCDLEPGRYKVCEGDLPGWTNVTPTCLDVDLGLTTEINQNFTNTLLPCIEGWKINYQTGEGIAGWTISLSNSSGRLKNTSTNFTGWYQFCDLEPGRYKVCEGDLPGWTNVTPTCLDVDLGLTTEINQNFVNRKLFCINGSKINNCTGKGLANWTIELKDDTGAVITTTVTDANGDYSFCNLEPGNYTVCEVLQGGWKNVTARCIYVALEIDNSEDNDFLNDPPVCISGTKINDCTDEGILGWKIFLYDALGNKIGDTVTDANGRYSFCNLDFGIYYVCEEEREGWTAVRDGSGSTGTSNSTSEPVTCNMPWCDDNCVCVNLGCDGAEVDFRNIPESLCINGSKINNCTGAGIAGWGIYLYDATGKNIAATQTDRNGRYSFCGLAPGQYRVCEEERDGYIPVAYINHSSASCLPESCTCDVCNNCIPVILDCKSSEENNFENIPPLSIRGRVIDDCTGLGLKGWTVKLYDDKGVQLTSRTTGDDGSYAFTSSSTGGLQLKAGTLYSVCEVVKDGYTPVTYHANNSSPAMSNEYCIPVVLECGETEVDDFENIPSLIISGHEFNRCTGEGLDGWTVHLKDGAGNILDTTTTDGAGYYEFSGRQPGWYTVCEDSIPEGWTSFREDPKSPAMALPDASAAPEDCEKPKCIVVRLDYCEESTDNDFENIPAFCIKGIVYNNSTEVAGFPVKIENSDATLILSIPTDANGEYSFCGLKAGTYTVCVDKPGWTADKPCVIVYLDCQDEEQDFDVYKGRSNVLPGIEQPAVTLSDSSGAVVQGERSDGPSETTEPDIGGDEEEGRQTQL